LAAGASRVVVPSAPPIEIRSERDLSLISEEIARPHALHLTAVHPMGTMHWGDDPRTSVVSSTGEHHQVKGLFVADGSLFPTSLGGPPQLTIYALALHVAPHAIAAARA
ncbi:MAG: GMC family oxidoreductase, partial [Polyangiales bacterium]